MVKGIGTDRDDVPRYVAFLLRERDMCEVQRDR